MDNQSSPENVSKTGDSQSGAGQEGLQPGAVEKAPAVEAAPSVGSGAPAQTPVAKPLTLSREEVEAAIAAVPPGSSPGAGVVAQGPSVAGDVDVIEPEWVERAELEVQKHQGDPYGEEEAIEDLQRDYLKKRYNYSVGDPDADDSKPEGA